MPTYDYECKKCGHTFDAFQAMSDDALVKCPSCGKNGLRRLIGGGLGIIFKGSGFYVNDSRSGSGGPRPGSDSSSDKPSKTPETSKPNSSGSGKGASSESKPTGDSSKSKAAT